MKRVLITGMSGVGKSTQIGRLRALGHKAVDADEPGWSADVDGEWKWREDRVAELLATEDADVVFLSGCSSNQGKFAFDHVVLLSVAAEVMAERLTTRTTNPYGKDPAELAESLEYKQTIEPLLRSGATLEIDTSMPADEVTAAILRHVGG